MPGSCRRTRDDERVVFSPVLRQGCSCNFCVRATLLGILLLSFEMGQVSSAKWDPDMRVPPTPTPPKSAWQRRRFGSEDSSSNELPQRVPASEMDDRNEDGEDRDWSSPLSSVSRRGDPMVMDTPLPKPSHSRAGQATRVSGPRSDPRKPRRKTAGSSESTIRKLQFDSPNEASGALSTFGEGGRGSAVPSSPQTPFHTPGKDDDASFLHSVGPSSIAAHAGAGSPDRVNTFATSPLSPLPPGSGGVGTMTRRLSHATSFSRDFFDVEEVGAGEHGKVFKCVRRMDLWPYAVKVLQRGVAGPRDRENVLQEIYALASQWENPHAVRYFNAWEEDDVVYIQTELCQHTLAEEWARSKPLPEARVWTALAHAACGLQHMHQQGVAHLDVKPSNLYVSMSGRIKLGDFGHASDATHGGGGDAEPAGDRRYVSRELLEGAEEVDLCKADAFSLGASILELLGPEPLPQAGKAYHAIRDGKVEGAVAQAASPELLHILRTLLDPNPRKRPSTDEILAHTRVQQHLSSGAKAAPRIRSNAIENRDMLLSSVNKAMQWGEEQERQAKRLQKQVEDLQRQLAEQGKR